MPYAVTVTRDVPYASPGGVCLRADLHLPRDKGSAVPVIVWIHGGGWRFGNRKIAPDLSRFFAERGFAMVAIDYRLSHQATFPAQIEDVKTAIRWVRSIADTHGVDGHRLGVWGVSAGGHLAALAALTKGGVFEPSGGPYGRHSSAVQAVVAGYPPIDFLQLDLYRPPPEARSEDPESLLLPRPGMQSADADSFESLLLGAPIETCPDRVSDANPITYIGPGAAPFLILHGVSDTTIAPQQSELLYAALAAHDNVVTLGLIETLGHGFLNRTHLDLGPARRMTIKSHRPGGGEHVERRIQPVFPMIEAFFTTHLVGA
jgi:acetyl esterase/lipase